MNNDFQSNKFEDSNNLESNQDELNTNKSKLVDIRIVLTNLDYIEPISKAVSNFDLSNFNVNISSIIPTDDIGVAKNTIIGADLVLIASPSTAEGKNIFNRFKKALKTDYNFVEYLKLPSLEEFDDYEYDYGDDNAFEDEIANSIIRAGLYSISNLYTINESKRIYNKLKIDFNENISKFDKASKENDILINESKAIREKNERLLEEVNILQKELDGIKSDYSDLKSRFESIHSKNSLEVYSLLDLWQDLFNESLSEESYKFILISTDNFRPKNLMVGQGVICAESKEDALDWLKVIKTAFILNDANQNDLDHINLNSNLNFDHVEKPHYEIQPSLEDTKEIFPDISFDDISNEDDIGNGFKPYSKAKDDFSEINVFNINSLRNLANDDDNVNSKEYGYEDMVKRNSKEYDYEDYENSDKGNAKEYDYEDYEDYDEFEDDGDYVETEEDIEDVSNSFSTLW